MKYLSRLNKLTWLTIFLYLSLFAFLFSTDPNNLSIGWLMLPFVWLFVCLFLTGIIIFDKVWFKGKRLGSSKKYTAAFLASSLPTLMLLLKSIDQLTVKDFVLFAFLYLIAIFYVSKIRFVKPS